MLPSNTICCDFGVVTLATHTSPSLNFAVPHWVAGGEISCLHIVPQAQGMALPQHQKMRRCFQPISARSRHGTAATQKMRMCLQPISVATPRLDLLPIPHTFCHHLGCIPKEIILKTNIGCNWRVSIVDHNGSAAIDNGWATFAMCHNLRIGDFLTFKLLKPNVYRVIILRTDGSKIVKKCDAHPFNLLVERA